MTSKHKKNEPNIVVTNVTRLAIAWQSLVAAHHTPGPLKPFTPKEKGQLSLFMRAVGTERAYCVMRWAIVNWYDLRIEVRCQKDLTVPPLPQPGMLLAHWDTARRMYQEQQESLDS